MFSIVMYHYVRQLEGSRYPHIRGLTLERFDGQLDYLQHHYHICSFAEILQHLRDQTPIPANACVLSFDDGFCDHFQNVFPRLKKRGLSGAFFAPVKAIDEHHVLDVHKIHFTLATNPDYAEVKVELLTHLHAHQGETGMPTVASLEEQFASANRLLSADERFIKYVLQKGIPREIRNAICTELFLKYVTADEAAFARELYVSSEDLQEMHQSGMEIGGHAYCHEWLATMTDSEQAFEIQATVDFLTRIHGKKPEDWVMTYPSGSYNDETIRLLKHQGCALACTSVPELADPDKPYRLDRLDTIDLPYQDQAPNAWTEKVLVS